MSKKYLILFIFLTLAITISTQDLFGTTAAPETHYKDASALEIVKDPSKYLNQNIQITAKFDKFTTVGLDYKGAFRSSEKYVGFTIQREDVKDHNIPLSEMKLFLKQEYAERVADLDTGDVIKIQGKVYSPALNDPWIDVDKIIVIKKAEKETK